MRPPSNPSLSLPPPNISPVGYILEALTLTLVVRKWWTIDTKILDVSGGPWNAIAVYICYFFIK